MRARTPLVDGAAGDALMAILVSAMPAMSETASASIWFFCWRALFI
jgi:hypothetical protein